MSVPDRPVAADWLALRRASDTSARDRAPILVERCRDLIGPRETVVIDVGAGTGANRAYLAPRLGVATRWVLLDPDPDLLAASGSDAAPRVLGGVADLDRLVPAYGVGLVTASALLDLLSGDDLDRLARVLSVHRVPGLFSLTVDGTVRIDPPNESDRIVAEAFNAHQRRAGRLGPGAAEFLASRSAAYGLQVTRASTPWELGPGQGALTARLLVERVEAVVELRPDLAGPSWHWLAARLDELAAGRLRVTVGHADLLVAPVPRSVETPRRGVKVDP